MLKVLSLEELKETYDKWEREDAALQATEQPEAAAGGDGGE